MVGEGAPVGAEVGAAVDINHHQMQILPKNDFQTPTIIVGRTDMMSLRIMTAATAQERKKATKSMQQESKTWEAASGTKTESPDNQGR